MNNCGPRKGWIDVPEFIFSASCKKHDELYIKGGAKVDRFIADYLFWYYMRKDAGWRLHYQLIAFVYFLGVRIGGHKHFNYG